MAVPGVSRAMFALFQVNRAPLLCTPQPRPRHSARHPPGDDEVSGLEGGLSSTVMSGQADALGAGTQRLERRCFGITYVSALANCGALEHETIQARPYHKLVLMLISVTARDEIRVTAGASYLCHARDASSRGS